MSDLSGMEPETPTKEIMLPLLDDKFGQLASKHAPFKNSMTLSVSEPSDPAPRTARRQKSCPHLTQTHAIWIIRKGSAKRAERPSLNENPTSAPMRKARKRAQSVRFSAVLEVHNLPAELVSATPLTDYFRAQAAENLRLRKQMQAARKARSPITKLIKIITRPMKRRTQS